MTNLLSAAQAAEVLGVSGGLVRKWLLEGRLPGQRIGKPATSYPSPSNLHQPSRGANLGREGAR